MRWKGRRQSSNVEDRRSVRGPVMVGGGGGILLLVVVVIALCMGADPRALLQVVENVPPPQQAGPGQRADPGQQAGGRGQAGGPEQAGPRDEMTEFVSVVLADTEDVWRQLFREMGKTYREPTLVLFRDQVASACGFQSAATGPFYCPLDQKLYIDLSFYEEMERKLNAPGDFAQAYVLAHEVGHHVQKLLGISDDVHSRQQRASKQEANELSVRLELQADFFAGVWAHHAQQNWNILEQGDIEEALQAATAIGDDRLQMRSRGFVVPETFTHGTSEQRKRWFFRGLKTGDMTKGDTFSLDYDRL